MKSLLAFASFSALLYLVGSPNLHAQQSAKPSVFMGLTGAEDLDGAKDSAWKTTITFLDGVWYNSAGMSMDSLVKILAKIPGRPVILPIGIDSRAPWKFDDPAISKYESAKGSCLVGPVKTIVINCDVARKSGQGDWQEGDLAKARDQYKKLGGNFYMVIRGLNFNANHTATDDIVETLIEKEADGTAFEISPFKLSKDGIFRKVFQNGWEVSKKRGKPMIWLAPVGVGEAESYLEDMKSAWKWLKKENIDLEAIVPINYGTNAGLRKDEGEKTGGALAKDLPSVPECDAKGEAVNSLTGVIYWLHQQINPASH